MALLQGILAAVFRSLGRILNTAFGWATILLFGKVPARKQTYSPPLRSARSSGSIAMLGIASPRVAAFLLAFVTLPDWFGDGWLRIAMLAVALIVPPVVGVLSILMVEAEDRPRGFWGKLRGVLRGYPYTIGLGLTLLIMMVFAPIMKLQAIARRWKAQHVPILVEAPHYGDVLADLERALRDGELETRREPATWMLRAPTRVLTFFAGSTLASFVASELTTLRGEGFEVLLHPSDLLVRGKEDGGARALILTERLTFTEAHHAEKEAHEIEDRLREIWLRSRDAGELGRLDRRALEELQAIERDMRRLELSYEEWEILFREKLQVERTILGTGLGLPSYHDLTAIERLAREAA